MRDDYEEKTMLGKRIEGYVCLNSKDDNIGDNDYVFIDICESIALPTREERKVEPGIYKVSGISRVKEYYTTYSGRTYYLCDDIKKIRRLTRKEIIDSAKVSTSHANRLISFYPMTEEEGLELAKAYSNDFYILKSLNEIFSKNEVINKLYETSKEVYLCENSKIKKYINK